MKLVNKSGLMVFLLILTSANLLSQENVIKQFTYFGQEREKIHDSGFYENPDLTGAQIRYAWRQLEPREGKYNFSEIEEDLAFLKSKGKALFIQIQDATFTDRPAVPQYLINDPAYHGGQAQQCEEEETGKINCVGFISRRWDPAVAARFHILLRKLGQEFDGRIEGINLPETAIGISAKRLPEGFNNKSYMAGIKGNMKVARESFKKSVAIQYANFMTEDQKGLKELYSYAREIKMGMGGPDIKVYKAFQMKNSYPLIRDISGMVTTGMAVQDGNYEVINGRTGKQVTVPEILDFAQNYLRLNYIFWCTQEPYYSQKVLPLLDAIKKKTQ